MHILLAVFGIIAVCKFIAWRFKCAKERMNFEAAWAADVKAYTEKHGHPPLWQ